jgi:hypothetical protein
MERMEGMVVVDGTVEVLITGAVEELIIDLLDVEEGCGIPYKKSMCDDYALPIVVACPCIYSP